MVDQEKAEEQLLLEVGELRQRVSELEAATGELTEVNERLRQELTECRQAEREIRHRLDGTTLLQRVSELIASASGMTDALQRVCAELAGFLRVPQAGFALLNPERTSAEVIADFHPPESPSAIGATIPVADNPSMVSVLESGAPLAVGDAQADPRLSLVHDIMRQRRVESILIVPVVADGEVIGTLGFDAFDPREFGASDVNPVQHVANQVGQLLLRKRAEAALERRAREMEYLKAFNERIVQSVAEGILLEDARGRITFANPAMEAMLGIRQKALLGRHWTSIFSRERTGDTDLETVRPSVDVQRRYEATLLGSGGRRVPVMVSACPVLERGQLAGVLSAFTDISDRVRAELAVQARRQYLEAVLNAAPDAIVTMDARHRIVEWNSGAEKLFGYSREEAVGRDLDDLVVSADSLEEAVAITRRAMDGETMAPVETVRTRKDGSPVQVILAGSPILVGGELTGTVGVYTDIGRRKQIEEELRMANRGLRLLGECNAVLSRARKESDLLRAICQIVVEIGGYRMAWVGIPERDEAKTVRPVAQAGFEEGYLDRVSITWADGERGRGPTGTAIRTHKPAITRDMVSEPDYAPWQEEATRRGYASSIALPLMADGRCLGALNIYASEPETFDPEEVSLLTELADNLAYGLAALRTRSERAWMQEVLRRYAERLEMLQQVDRAILEAQSPEAIAQATLARIGHLVPCQKASVLVFGPEKTPRTLAEHVSEHAPGEGAATPVLDGGRPLSIPLMVEGELLGVLRLTPSHQDTLSREHIEIAYEVAAPLAVAIQHARLNEQIRAYAGSLEETIGQRTRELRAERDRTRAILESLGEAVLVTDAQGTILYANPATTELTGFAGEELLGQSWRLLLGDGSGDQAYARAQQAMRARQAWRSEARAWRKDDTPYDAAVTVTPLFDPDEAEQLIGSVWVQRDITLLKEADRAKDRFVSNVSHELRTPLSIITLMIGNLDRLYQQLEDERRRDMIQSVREHVGVLNDLVGDVLEISRIDSGRVSLERRGVDLVQLVGEEMAKQQPLALKKLQRLEASGARSIRLRGNEGQLRQIVRNLLNNAIKFTPNGGEIRCEFRRGSADQDWGTGWPGSAGLPAGHWAVLRVVDNGIGIEPGDVAHLFERFYRVETQGDVAGTGLGLAIARELVELHGGHIAVDSTAGEGSIFAVYLPLEEER